MGKEYTRGSLAERLERHSIPEPNTGCWLWMGAIGRDGYGKISVRGRPGQPIRAHIASYQLRYGEVPSGLELDHLCRTRSCINPDHLEAVTHRENVLRGISVERRRQQAAAITHCVKSHPLTGSNLYIAPRGTRVCRACQKDAVRSYRNRKATRP